MGRVSLDKCGKLFQEQRRSKRENEGRLTCLLWGNGGAAFLGNSKRGLSVTMKLSTLSSLKRSSPAKISCPMTTGKIFLPRVSIMERLLKENLECERRLVRDYASV